MKRILLLSAVLAGCAATAPEIPPPPAPAPAPASGPDDARPEAPTSANVAVAGLVNNARAESAAGRLANAGATLERALRIEPRNARLWHELAKVRFKQGDYAQVESLAARSNTWAGADAALQAENSRLIADARAARIGPPR